VIYLVLLVAVLDTDTGNSERYAKTHDFPFPVVTSYPMQPLDKLLNTQRTNAEGFVLQFFIPSQVRVEDKAWWLCALTPPAYWCEQ
jgi:hypothetical protein